MKADEVLGQALSSNATNLLAEVRSMSASPIRFRLGSENVIGGTNPGLAKTRTWADGSAEITLPENFDECMLAHELLHVALKRRGIPQVVRVAHLDGPYPLLATHLEDALHHPPLYHELRHRGFDDSLYWLQFVESVAAWSGRDSGLPSEAIGRAFLIAEMISLSRVDPSGTLEKLSASHPVSLRLAEGIAEILRPDGGMVWTRHSRMRSAGLRVLRYLTEECRRVESDFPNLRECLGVTLVATPAQLRAPAAKNLEIRHVDEHPETIIFRARGDGSLCESTSRLSAQLAHEMRDDLHRLTLEAWLAKYGMRYVAATQ